MSRGRAALVGAALAWGTLGCGAPARPPEDARAASDRTEMRHVFRMGAAQIAASTDDPRGALDGYRAFLEGCEPDPTSEVCSRNRAEAVLGVVRAFARVEVPTSEAPLAHASSLVTKLHDDPWLAKNPAIALEVHATLWREIASRLRSDDVLSLAKGALARWGQSADAPVLLHRIAITWTEVAAARAFESDRAAALAAAEVARRGLARAVVGPEAASRTPADQRLSNDLWIEAVELAAREQRAFATRLSSALPWESGLAREEDLLRAIAAWSAAAAHEEELSGIAGDPRAAFEARVRLAEARREIVAARVRAGRTPPPDEVALAQRDARAVCAGATPDLAGRACQIAVDVARLVVDDGERLFREGSGASGLALRDAVSIDESSPESPRVVKVPIPAALADLLAAMDAYVARATSPRDARTAREYRARAAEHYLFHGEIAEAKKRLTAMGLPEKSDDPLACKAWSRLETIAFLEQDIPAARRAGQALFESACSPFDPSPRSGGCILGSDSWSLFQRAQATTAPEERRAAFLRAARSYEEALLRAPLRDEAPEAVFNGAHAYRQAGQFEPAIRLYQMLVTGYAAPARLDELQRTDTTRYNEHVYYLRNALEALASARVLSFDFEAAAVTYLRLAEHARLPIDSRRSAAVNAVLLLSALGDPEGARSARTLALSLSPAPADKTRMDAALTSAAPAKPRLADKRASRPSGAKEAGKTPSKNGGVEARPSGKVLLPPFSGVAPMLPVVVQ